MEVELLKSGPRIIVSFYHTVDEMNSMSYIPISILHCGGTHELEFIKQFNKAKSLPSLSVLYDVQYITYRQERERHQLLLLNARHYHRAGHKVIVLLSKRFFKLVWATSVKCELLRLITAFKRECLHIWLDVDDKYVRSRSVALVSTKLDFHRVSAADLCMDVDPEFYIRLYSELHYKYTSSSSTRYTLLNNYNVSNMELVLLEGQYYREHASNTI